VMLEVHPDPENAAVDPLQPLNYSDFNDTVVGMQAVAKAVGRRV